MYSNNSVTPKSQNINDKIIKQLSQQIARLPGVNFRQAKKITAHIMSELTESRSSGMAGLISMLNYTKEKIVECKICHNVYFNDICDVCKSDYKKQSIICVVENLHELWRMQKIENGNFYYHIIGGIISASGGLMPNELNLESLYGRIESSPNITEVIIILNKSYDGSITTNYIADLLNKRFNSDECSRSLIISTPADGLPQGVNFDFIDDRTLELSLSARQILNKLLP